MRVAVAQWALRDGATLNEFAIHARELVQKSDGADLLVLPELISLELLATAGERFDHLAEFAPSIEEMFLRLSAESRTTIVAGSHLRQSGSAILNQALTVTPHGASVWTTKQVLTQWELNEMGLQSSPDWHQPKDFGVSVCYDCEFPEGGRALAETGRLLHAVPSFTETAHGFYRVRWSCHARAIENQVLVVHAALAGHLGREPVPCTAGSSAIIAPSVPPYPADGVLAETREEDGIAIAEVNVQELLSAREAGDVRNWNDRRASQWRVVSR